MRNYTQALQKTIYYGYLVLFFLTPLLFYPLTKYFPFPWIWFGVDPMTYELFEFNKMFFVYGITTVIACAWILKSIGERKILFRKTFLDYPLALFLASQVLSTIFSLDVHTSLWGYYSRFHGGLISTICYAILYWCLVSNLNEFKYISKFIFTISLSSILVAVYGTAQHFGVDAEFWVQNVKARVFSSLGQPNWLAAYMVALIPVSFGMFLSSNSTFYRFYYGIAAILQYICFLYTASRSGLLALIISMLLFTTLIYSKQFLFSQANNLRNITQGLIIFLITSAVYAFVYYKQPNWVIIVSLIYLCITLISLTLLVNGPKKKFILGLGLLIFIFGLFNISPDNFRLGRNGSSNKMQVESSTVEAGGMETGRIRFIVWNGAWEIFKKYPVLGSGVESFAYSFYQYRPIELLSTTEWDFLYNKAHNEYLNFLATSGAFGLIVYGIYIFAVLREASFAYYKLARNLTDDQTRPDLFKLNVKGLNKNTIANQNLVSESKYYLIVGLTSGFVTILITNFFGFSVVIIGLFFYIFAAFFAVIEFRDRFSLNLTNKVKVLLPQVRERHISKFGFIAEIVVVILSVALLTYIIKFWFADIHFAQGREYNRTGQVGKAYAEFVDTLKFRKDEPFYYSEVGWTQGAIVYQFAIENDASEAAKLAPAAAHNAEKAVLLSPNNINYWKKLADTYYNLSFFDDKEYKDKLRKAADRSRTLAPTDVSTHLTLSTYYEFLYDYDTAIKIVDQATKWKPDLAEAWYRLGEIYFNRGKNQNSELDLKKAEEYRFKATTVDPTSEEWKMPYQ